MRQWDLYPTLSASMPLQMAVDEILFRRKEAREEDSLSNPILRFYFSSQPWVTIGYSHGSKDADNGDAVGVCKRLTGGGAVKHGNDLIFSIIAYKKDDESFSQVRLSYLKIHEVVKEAMEALGFKPEFYRCDEDLPKGRECFDFPIATDLALRGRKVAGGSQKRSSGTFLHQESIQLDSGLEWETLMPSLIKSFEKKFRVVIKEAQILPSLITEAEELAASRYEQDWSEIGEGHGRIRQLS